VKKCVTILITLAMLTVCLPLFARPSAETGEELTILYVPGETDPFYLSIELGAKDKAEELGVNFVVSEYPKAWGPEVQVPVLEAAVARANPDLVMIGPSSNDAMIAPLKKLYDEGIEIITVDTWIGDGDYSKPSDWSFPLAYIGTDNKLGGTQIAEKLAQMIGEKGKVYCNTTSPDVSSTQARYEGFAEGIKRFPNVQLVGVDYNLEQVQRAQQQTFAALQANPDIKGIFGTNNWSSQGAYQAVVNAGLTGNVKIAGWDASEELISALKEGKLDLLLAQKPREMGSLCVEWGYRHFKEGAEIPKKVIPGFEFFTRENVDDPDMQKWIYGK
jgi:ribose transport system substrate-binding protein